MTPHRTLVASAVMLVLAGPACTGNAEEVDVPGAAVGEADTAVASPTTSTEPPPATTAPPAPTTTTTTTEPPPQTTEAPAPTTVATAPPTEPAPETTVVANPDFLRPGDESPRVGLIQFKLVALGYLPTGGDTAVFDAATTSAVLKFQSDYGLIVDGVIGPETDRAITAAAESINPEQ